MGAKIAVCFSGHCGGSVAKNVESHKAHFDGDFFFGVWDYNAPELEKQLPDVNYLCMQEVKMHYHPILDVVVSSNDRSLKGELSRIRADAKHKGSRSNVKGWHRTKQHLAHAMMVESLPPEYDLIIRSRYDTRVSDKVDFGPYLTKAYDEGIVVGFGKALGRNWFGDRDGYSFDALMPSQHTPPNYVSDFLIIHRRDMFDPARVFDLHEKKELLPAEMGWWQLLSEPNGGGVNILGGASLERFERYEVVT